MTAAEGLARPEGRNQIRSTIRQNDGGQARPINGGQESEILDKSESRKTQNSKQTITSYFDGGYGSRIPISSTKDNKLKDCSTDCAD